MNTKERLKFKVWKDNLALDRVARLPLEGLSLFRNRNLLHQLQPSDHVHLVGNWFSRVVALALFGELGGGGEGPALAFELGENAITTIVLERIELSLEKCLVVHICPFPDFSR